MSVTLGTATTAARLFFALNAFNGTTSEIDPNCAGELPAGLFLGQNCESSSSSEVGVPWSQGAEVLSAVTQTFPSAASLPAVRELVAREVLVGELRRRGQFESDWDGEDAMAPSDAAVKDAIAFARLLGDDTEAEPMLSAKGTVGLFWKTAQLYAHIEFLGEGKVAYYIERNGDRLDRDKHKGVVNFDSNSLPAVFENLLPV